MTSLDFKIRHVRIDDIVKNHVAIQIAVIQARRDVDCVMSGLEVIQPKLAQSIALRECEAFKTAVVRTVCRSAVHKMNSREGLSGDCIDYAATSGVCFGALARLDSNRCAFVRFSEAQNIGINQCGVPQVRFNEGVGKLGLLELLIASR